MEHGIVFIFDPYERIGIIQTDNKQYVFFDSSAVDFKPELNQMIYFKRKSENSRDAIQVFKYDHS